MGVGESFRTGGIVDTAAMEKEDEHESENDENENDEPHGILGRYLYFQRMNLVHSEVVPSHNILDKGYRLAQTATRTKQFVIQPNFCAANRNFKGPEILNIFEVVSDRSGNEWAVKLLKYSKPVKDDISPHSSYDRMEKLVKAFSFQCNFMFKPVH